MTSNLDAAAIQNRPSLLLTTADELGLRTRDDLRGALAAGEAKQIYDKLVAETQAVMQRDPYTPKSACPYRLANHLEKANRDFVIVDAVAHRLMNDALLWLLTDDPRYRADAIAQLTVLFDKSCWPSWSDQTCLDNGLVADLRTGQFLRAIGYTYDWLYRGLTSAQRKWIVDNLDARAIGPLLCEIEREAWFTQTDFMNNWNTVVLGGAGIAGMALGAAHRESEGLIKRAVDLMERYLQVLGPAGEFNESVDYAGAMRYPIEFFRAYQYHTLGRTNRLQERVFSDFCHWYMHFVLPPGRSARFGDCNADAPPKSVIFPAVASATGNGVFQWFYIEHADAGLNSDPALELLFFDPGIAPISPEGQLPRGRAYPSHGATWSSRTDWNPRNTACAVYGKAGHGGECHGHQDAGQLCVDIAARPMIVDLGSPGPSYPKDFFDETRWRYYNAGVVGHNVLMFNQREMRNEACFKAKMIDAQFDDYLGGYWSVDTTDLYDEAISVKRTVIHLMPAIIVVLDEAELETPQDISLRWHTANDCEPDGSGRFIVENDGAWLVSQMQRLDGAMDFRRRQHMYHPPFDQTRLGTPLDQRRESYIEAMCHGAACRILTLFSGYVPGQPSGQWEQRKEVWTIETSAGLVNVKLDEDTMHVGCENGEGWTLPLSSDIKTSGSEMIH